MNTLISEAGRMNISLTDSQLGQFEKYQALLMQWNQRMNLTAVRDEHGIQRKLFANSLSCLLVTGPLAGKRLVDVGTGGGFPGIPLKLMYPTLSLTLVESVVKKTRFLDAVIDQLSLADATVLPIRAEEVGQMPAHREQYDWAVARAVAKLPVVAEYLLPLLRISGHMLAQKGLNIAAELESSRHAIRVLGGGHVRVRTVQGANQQEEQTLISAQKLRQTPNQYPRRVGMPAKRPLMSGSIAHDA